MGNGIWQHFRLFGVVLVVLGALSAPVFAMSGDDEAAAAGDPNYAAGLKAIEAMQWQEAVDAFSKVVAADENNANGQNYLGYAHRKLGDLDQAIVHYKKALIANPDHRGAHEYIGQAYLMAKDLVSAEKHLDALDSLCFFGCAEYDSLKQAVKEYRANSS